MTESPRRKVALVTGGARRVGNYVTQLLAQNDYDVAIHYNRSRQEAERAAGELTSKYQIDAATFQADLTDGAAGENMVDAVVARFGRLDVVVTCASVWKAVRLEDADHRALEQMWRANTLATYTVAWKAGLHMIRQEEGGCIVLVGDWAVQRPYRDYLPYFVAKGAIEPMVRTLAIELANRNPRVRVNGIHPGPILLPDSMSPEERDAVRRQTLVKHIGSPYDLADAVLFFARHPFVTGVMLPVDGGRTIYCGDEALPT